MQIFISYSSKSRPLVIRLAKDLDEMGHEVWYDQALTGGHKWWATILENIRECDVFMIAVTEPYMDSKPCQLEYEYAFALKRAVVPVTLDKVNIRLLPKVIQELQLVEYGKVTEKAKMSLVKTLTRLPRPQPLPDPLPPEPDAPLSPLAELHEQIRKPRLSAKNQWDIVNQLRDFTRNPTDADDARTLLREMLQRDDLLLKVANEINLILEEKSTRHEPASTTSRSSSAMVMSGAPVMAKGESMESYVVERLRFLETEYSRVQSENFDLRVQSERDRIERQAIEEDKARIEREIEQLRSKQVQGLIRQIDREVERGEWSKLLVSTDKFKIQVEIDYPSLYFKRALAYQKQGNLDAALENYDKAIELDPSVISSLNNRGVVHRQKGNFVLAMADYNRVLELDPLDGETLSNRGDLYKSQRKFDLALADFNKAIEFKPDLLEAYLGRGYTYYKLDLLNDALENFETACRLRENNPEGHNNRAYILFQLDRIEEAQVAWKLSTDLPEAPDYAFAGHAVSLQKLGNRDLARKQYQTAIQMDARWRDDLNTIANRYIWTPDMIALAREILKGIKRK